jgi:hypothetical protein
MADRDFIIFNGVFYCKKCNEQVNSIRFWTISGDATWMCSKKHLSKVGLVPQKRKKTPTNE